ncbi:SprT-like domain-containing protein [Schaalia sp. lx-260]|uniref:SprT-like domain-containing protein n=1 Tax=Schaalia sp. lx-260 TaxID=2899082 RepID=UPI001E424984|nr:SprT-like domain-containing protein [Schaalia sp. lx-260]MCD4550108.1 SprT-like domain-containing protein [Schaalia sp. lx-260]
MDLDAARRLARSVMDAHGLSEWDFSFDRARRRAGACHHQRKKITLSRVLTLLYEPATVREVVLHEVAHALVGAHHGHDQVWRDVARRIGAPPKASLPAYLPAPEPSWVGTCPRCGMQKFLYRSPQRVASCGACSPGSFSSDVILEWTFRGLPRQPGRTYLNEMRRLRRWGLIR